VDSKITRENDIFRHQGFYAEADVLKQVKKLGVE